MLRPVSTMLAAATFAVGLTAQVPEGFLLVGVEDGGGESAVRAIDLSNGVVTPVFSRDASGTMARCLGVCEDTASTGTLYLHGSPGGFLGPELRPLVFTAENNVHPVPSPPAGWTSLTPAGYPGFSFPQECVRIAGSNLLATVISGGSNNGLWVVDLSSQTVTSEILLPVNLMTGSGFAENLAVIDSKVYLGTEPSAFGPSVVYEWDSLTATTRVVSRGPTLDLRSIGAIYDAAATPPTTKQVLVGDSVGDLYTVNLTNGARTLFLATGSGLPVVAIASRGGAGDPIYIALRDTDPMSGNVVDRVYDTTDLVNPVYTFESVNTFNGIAQMFVGSDSQAVHLAFGQGCDSTAMTTPRHEHINRPSIGNLSFQIGLTGAPAMAPAVIHLGLSRTTSSGGPLPIDLSVIGMTGCSLYTEPIAVLGVAVDALGDGSFSQPVPNNPTFIGARLYSQFPILDIGANALGVIASDGAEFIVK